MMTTDDYTPELADAIALVRFGRGSRVEPAENRFVVVRCRPEYNETIRPAGACTRVVLGEGATRRAALDDAAPGPPAGRGAELHP